MPTEPKNWNCCYCGKPVFDYRPESLATTANGWTEHDPDRPPLGLKQWLAHPACFTSDRPAAFHPAAEPRLITAAPT